MAHLAPSNHSLAPRWVFSATVLMTALACTSTYVAADGTDGAGGGDEDGTGGLDGGDGAGGDDAAGGSEGDTGGASAGGTDAGTGGAGSATGGGSATACDASTECVPAADFDDECFSPTCSAPVAATAEAVDSEPCLVHWDDRESEIPEECAAFESDAGCPAICEIQPPCVDATCGGDSECEIEICLK